jgi:hypothetical protein
VSGGILLLALFDAGRVIVPAILLLAAIFAMVPRLRKSAAARRAAIVSGAVFASTTYLSALHDDFATSTGEYPALAAAYASASPKERREMCRVATQMSRTLPGGIWIRYLSRSTRDRFLAAGGYCTSSLPGGGCKPLPTSREAEGMVVENFPAGEYGPSCPRGEWDSSHV